MTLHAAAAAEIPFVFIRKLFGVFAQQVGKGDARLHTERTRRIEKYIRVRKRVSSDAKDSIIYCVQNQPPRLWIPGFYRWNSVTDTVASTVWPGKYSVLVGVMLT